MSAEAIEAFGKIVTICRSALEATSFQPEVQRVLLEILQVAEDARVVEALRR